MKEQIRTAWTGLSLTAKLIALAVTAAIFLTLGYLIWDWLSALASGRADARIEVLEQERTAERAEWQREIDRAIARAEAAEKQEEEARAKELIARAAVEAAGQRAETALKKAEEADEQFKQEMADIGADVDVCARLRRVCSRLGIADKDCPCQ